MRTILRALSLAVAVLLFVPDVRSEDLAEAKRLFDAGVKSYQLGEYPKAIEAHKRAFELSGNPILLFDLGQSYRKLGDSAQAIHFYKQFIATNPRGKMRQDAVDHVERLEALMASADRTKAAPPNGLTSTDPPPTAPVQPTPVPPVADNVTAPVKTAAPRRVRPWVWGVVAGSAVVVLGLSVGLGVGLTRGDRYPSPDGTVNGN